MIFEGAMKISLLYDTKTCGFGGADNLFPEINLTKTQVVFILVLFE